MSEFSEECHCQEEGQFDDAESGSDCDSAGDLKVSGGIKQKPSNETNEFEGEDFYESEDDNYDDDYESLKHSKNISKDFTLQQNASVKQKSQLHTHLYSTTRHFYFH